MKNLLNQNKTTAQIHFIAIGGIGMSGLAEWLLLEGYKVSGSDISDNANVQRLKSLGAQVYIGHEAQQINGATLIVTSTAIKANNPELLAAQAAGLTIIHRGQLLAEILKNYRSVCVAGTHGKTTTTALTFTALANAGVINGGVLPAISSNIKHVDNGEIVVAEADESDQSFLHLRPQVGIITNIEAEHLEHYNGDFANQQNAFIQFAKSCEQVVLCADDDEVMALKTKLHNHPITTYGFAENANIRAENISQQGLKSHFDLIINGVDKGRFCVNLPGRHYVQNTLAALAVAHLLNAPLAAAATALENFQGVGRRFTQVGHMANGALVVDDYGHHPTEITATLKAARAGFKNGKLIAVIQPHRYTRLKEHFAGFASCAKNIADQIIFTPVYSAGEDEIAEINHINLAAKAQAETVENCAELQQKLANLTADDVVLMLGAGTITQWAKKLVEN